VTRRYAGAVEAALLDLYDTVARTHWGRFSDAIAAELGIDKRHLYRAYDVTRSARAVGTFGDQAGDMRAVVEAAGLEAAPDLIDRLVAMEVDFSRTGIELWEDARPVVSRLRERGVKTALISNCSHSTRPIVDRLGLDELFDTIVLSFEVGSHKPDPAIYLEALRRLGGVPPERAVFVDDQTGYCDGAAALGIGALLIARDGLDDVEADGYRVIRDLGPLLSLD
jgi:putative hydrolase of the HAD superfamily